MSADPVRRLRLLFLAPFAPRLDATHGGGRAIAELVVQLGQRHDVALLYLRGVNEPAVDRATRAACDLVREVPRPSEHGPMHWARLAAAVLRSQPMWVAGWRVPAFEDELRRLVTEWRPDVVQVEYQVMGQYLPAMRPGGVPRVLRQPEPGAPAAAERAQSRNGIGRWISELDRRAWVRYEAALMHDAEAVVALTDRDAAALRALTPEARIECIPLGMAIPPEPLDPVGEDVPSVVFVGNFGHPPNVDAATRLAQGIFPGIRAACPSAVLRIVGPDPTGRITSLAGDGVIVTGEVPEVEPLLAAAGVVMVPLRLGGGMRVKVMEALALGKAVVASPLAVEGLAVTPGEQVLLAATDEEFVAAGVALLLDASRRGAMARRARTWAALHLGWERPLAAFEALYASLLAA